MGKIILSTFSKTKFATYAQFMLKYAAISRKFVQGGIMGYTAKSEEIRRRYYSRFLANLVDKPGNEQLLMERTFATACMVAENVEAVSIPELIMGIMVFQYAFSPGRFPRLYAGLMSSAKTDPEDFVFQLHSFYEATIAGARKQHLQELAGFLGSVMRAHVEKRKVVGSPTADSCMNLALQTLEYMRPNRYAFETCVYGVTTDGKPLAGPCPLPYSDLPSIEIQHEIDQGKQFSSADEYFRTVQQKYAAHGMALRTPYDFEKLERIQRTHINTVAALLPFINETTWDMAPIAPHTGNSVPLANLSHVPIDQDLLKEKLWTDRVPLPEGMVIIGFEDPEESIIQMVLMETRREDKPYILYRLETNGGCFHGYYDILDGFLYSILRETSSPVPFRNFLVLFLVLYAALVLPATGLPKLNTIFKQDGQPLGIKLP